MPQAQPVRDNTESGSRTTPDVAAATTLQHDAGRWTRGASSDDQSAGRTQLQRVQDQQRQRVEAGDSATQQTAARDDPQQLQQSDSVHVNCEAETAGASNNNDDSATNDGSTQHAEHEAATEQIACMPQNKQGKNKNNAIEVSKDWDTLRRARTTKAKAAHAETVKDARAAQRAARRGEGQEQGAERKKRGTNEASEAKSGEYEGKRRRVVKGRDGTGAVPAAVT